VHTQPSFATCTVANGSNAMGAKPVTNIAVTCAPVTFTVGGTISGLGNTRGLVLANGSDRLTVPANATTFTMPTGVPIGAVYDITVQTHPPLESCAVTNGTGPMAGTAITNVAVACTSATESVLYSFGSKPNDAYEPYYSSLALATDGNLYGLTYYGGINDYGAAFEVTPTGTESVLWSFGTSGDGYYPEGSLIQGSDGNFYGMTREGGGHGDGAVFKITPAGVETDIWAFGTGTDGDDPYGSLVQGSDGSFYGMTEGGGVQGTGTVFKITSAGVETVLWSFGAGTDGFFPYGSLIQGRDGNFYGMTYSGGTNGSGIVFKITPAGTETVLYSFGGGTDGANPYGDLMQATDGNFYGMTYYGGTNNEGTAFKITPAGVETVLWSFGSGNDGTYPYGNLVQGSDGNFYGLGYEGGANNAGTIFQLTPSGTETVLWSFGAGLDAAYPCGSLTIGPDGTLYTSVYDGGSNSEGAVIQYK
jgi:uncharacterized repeat protein (TIGR03803 family)